MDKILSLIESLPSLSPVWPCISCGADQASSYNLNDSLQVTDCNNCIPMKLGKHLNNGDCWCHPRIAFRCEGDGKEVWIHNERQ